MVMHAQFVCKHFASVSNDLYLAHLVDLVYLLYPNISLIGSFHVTCLAASASDTTSSFTVSQVKPVECVVHAGEILFVPHGWWHMAINLEESIAITQNYVSTINLPHVLKFLQPGREDLVSGCALEER